MDDGDVGVTTFKEVGEALESDIFGKRHDIRANIASPLTLNVRHAPIWQANLRFIAKNIPAPINLTESSKQAASRVLQDSTSGRRTDVRPSLC